MKIFFLLYDIFVFLNININFIVLLIFKTTYCRNPVQSKLIASRPTLAIPVLNRECDLN